MAVYDSEHEETNDLTPADQEADKKSLSPEELAERESEIADGYGSKGGEFKRRFDEGLGRHGKVRDASLAADAQERAELNQKLGDTVSSLYNADKEAGRDTGFFKDDSKKKGGLFGKLGSSKKKLGIAGGVATLLVGGAIGLFSFLNTFRLDQILNMLDQQTFSRFNASFEGRSDKWFRAYVQLRLAEHDGGIDTNNNPVFRARKVDTNNPARDWYRTLRTSSFETDLAKSGIVFESQFVDGRNRLNVLKIDGVDMLPDLTSAQVRSGNIESLVINSGVHDQNISSLFDGPAENNKAARRQIKTVVNDRTKSYQVFKRRHLRKDIANMTGISNWRLFEKTRDKIDNAKIGIQRKIVNKVFSGDSGSMRFLNCLFSGERCPTSSDVVDPDNKATTTAAGTINCEGNSSACEQLVDEDGKPVGGVDDITKEVTEATQDALEEGAEELTENSGSITESVLKHITDITSKLAGPNLWGWAQKLTSIHHLFDGGTDSRIVMLIKNARLTQLTAFYTTVSIARDQIKSGELVGDELNGFYDMTKNFGNSEAWSAVGNTYSSGASAATSTNTTKDKYCSSEHDRSFDEYAWYCDKYKPNGGTTAEEVSTVYDKTIGWIIAPIASVVDNTQKIPGVSWVLDRINSITGAFGELAMAALEAVGLGDDVGKLVGSAVAWLMDFVGAGPFIDPAKPGFASFLVGGSAGTAESTTRGSGGIKSTETSYNYSKQLASNYERDQLASASWSERYLSLENPKSVASNLALSLSNITAGENLTSKVAGAFTSLPSNIFSTFLPRASAANSDLARLAGVDTYDIPQVCMELDPLDPDYEIKATNAQIPGLTYEILTNNDLFWEAVYANEQPQVGDDKEKIYNCALLDTRVRGSLGYLYGYTDDGGMENGESSSGTPSVAAGAAIVGDPFASSIDVACAANTIDLDVHESYNDGVKTESRLCAIPNIPSQSQESTPGSEHYIDGANGKVIVNSRVSGAVYAMAVAAAADGIPLTANSSFRTMSHQQELWNKNPNPKYTARPGESNHQSGTAIDFNAGGVKGGTTCAARARAPSNAMWNWLFSNAEKYGYRQYAAESWHWDPSISSRTCDSSQ